LTLPKTWYNLRSCDSQPVKENTMSMHLPEVNIIVDKYFEDNVMGSEGRAGLFYKKAGRFSKKYLSESQYKQCKVDDYPLGGTPEFIEFGALVQDRKIHPGGKFQKVLSRLKSFTPDQVENQSIYKSYNADLFLVVHDPLLFDEWLERHLEIFPKIVKALRKAHPKAKIMMLSLTADEYLETPDMRSYTKEQSKSLARSLGISFAECNSGS